LTFSYPANNVTARYPAFFGDRNMKTVRLGIVLLFLAAFARGETTNALEIKSYSPEDGIVEIKTGAGTTNRTFTSFSAEEQAYITGWFAGKEFKSSGLQVTIKTEKTTVKTDANEGRRKRRGEVDRISYIIELENRTAAAFNNVAVTCQIFYETQDGTKEAKRCTKETCRLDFPPGKTQTIKTRSVSIRDEILQTPGKDKPSVSTSFGSFGGGSSGGEPTVYYKDRLKGLYVCVSKPDRTGANVILEFEDGRPPDEDKRADYQAVAASVGTLNKSSLEAPVKKDLNTKNDSLSSEENIAAHIKRAEQGSLKSSYFLCTYYHQAGDSEKAKQWATKTRALLSQQAPGDQFDGIKQRLDRIEADSAGKR
jgi:hypothetical protein